MRAFRSVVGFLAAALGLVGLLAGAPWALVRWGEWPITGLPTARQVVEAPAALGSDHALLGILTVALWVCWAVFVVCVVAEVVAQLRGGVPAVDLGGPVQRLAAFLVGSLLIGVGAPAAGAAPALLDPPVVGELEAGVTYRTAPVAAPVPADPGPGGAEVTAVDAPPVAGVADRTVRVERGDTAWSLAERHLGDGMRWRELWELNRFRPQDDGSVWSGPDDAVQPGWRLLRPPDGSDVLGRATGAAAPRPADESEKDPQTVGPEDVVTADRPGEAGPAAGPARPAEGRDGRSDDGGEVPPAAGGGPSPTVDGSAGPMAGGTAASDGADRPPARAGGDPAPVGGTDDRSPAPDEPGDAGSGDADERSEDPSGEPAGEPSPTEDDAAEPAPVDQVVVQPGDHFWGIAKAQITDAWGREPTDAEMVGYWQELVDANHDRLLPPGDPDLIYPDQVFVVTPVPADPTAPAPDGDAASDPDAEDEAEEAETEADAEPGPEPAPDDGGAGGDGSTGSGAGDDEASADDVDADEVPIAHGPPVVNPSGLPTEPGGDADDASAGGNDRDGDPAVGPAAGAGEDGSGSEVGPPDPGAEHNGSAGPGGRVDLDPTLEPTVGPPTDTAVPQPPSAPVGSTAAVDTAAAEDESSSGGGSLAPVGLVGGGIALAGVLVLLERRRRAQQRHRRPGRTVPMPDPDLEQAEHELRHGVDVRAAELLDAALRAAAAGCGTTGLPSIRWVETTEDAVVLVLDEPSPAPPGFRNLAADRWGTTVGADDLATMGASAAPPVPTLVPVGATEAGSEVLVELESHVVLAVDGTGDDARDVLRAMAVTAASSPWNEQTQVLLVGMDGEPTKLPWVRPVAGLDEALVELEARADATEAALRAIDCVTTAQARSAGVMADEWDPVIVVSAVPAREGAEAERLRALAARPHRGVALVLPTDGEPLPGRRFTLRADGTAAVERVDVSMWPRVLDEHDAEGIVELLDVAGRRDDRDPADAADGPEPVRRPTAVAGLEPLDLPDPIRLDLESLDELLGEPPTVAEPGGEPVPVGALPAGRRGAGQATQAPDQLRAAGYLDHIQAEVDVLVRVLGEVEVVRLHRDGTATDPAAGPGAGPVREEKLVPTRQKGLEAVAYLALRESAVDREDLEIALFPDGSNAAKTVYNTISAARGLVGDDLFPPAESGRYELSERVVSDYGLFCELVGQAEETEDAERAAGLLAAGLALVRGEPFVGVGRSYAWVGAHRGMIIAQVIDAADELGEIRLDQGDWRAAEWAARRGLLAFPADERMYRLLMRTARAAGNTPGVQRVFRELCDVIADPDFGVEPEDTLHPETVALFEELTGRTPRFGD